MVHHKVGERVEEPANALFTVHANDADRMAHAIERLHAAVEWSDDGLRAASLVLWGSRVDCNVIVH